ncbi:DUF2190 family protein [Marivita sp. S2033]|uniref:DUF2190 family protein n=1 Tax=Marivita sp. S2033 TaxID=3373187 RepID=UPI00398232BC
MKNYVQTGDNITIPATVAVTSGEVVIAGELIGVAAGDAGIGETVDLVTRGVFNMSKVGVDAFTIGAPVFYDEAVGLVTTEAAGNPEIGLAVTDAASASGAVNVRLHG